MAASTTVRLDAAFNRFFPRYLAALRDLGWPVDVLSAHLYPASLGTPDERAAFVAQVTDQLALAGAPDLPVWDTELNYGLSGPGPAQPPPDDRRRRGTRLGRADRTRLAAPGNQPERTGTSGLPCPTRCWACN